MYGSIFRMRPKAGREAEVVALLEDWGRTRGPHVKGTRGGYFLRPNDRPGELIGVAVFEDRATYEANAKDPAQDEWFRKLRGLLDADPAWEDGTYVVAQSANSDAARIVAENNAAFNSRNLDAGAAMLTTDAVLHDLATGAKLVGPNGLRQYWQAWHTAFPDGKIDDSSVKVTHDGTVVNEFVARGTHSGPLMGPGGQQLPPTGRRIESHFCVISSVRGGKIASSRVYYDMVSLLAQLGVATPATSAQSSPSTTQSSQARR